MTNDFVALLKDTSLVSVLTVVELTKQTSDFRDQSRQLGLAGGALCGAITRDVAAAATSRALERGLAAPVTRPRAPDRSRCAGAVRHPSRGRLVPSSAAGRRADGGIRIGARRRAARGRGPRAVHGAAANAVDGVCRAQSPGAVPRGRYGCGACTAASAWSSSSIAYSSI